MFRDYFKLIKFRYHLTFISVIVGALIFSPKITYSLIPALLLVYFSFNILMYSGLYTMNDIADCKSDALHPKKKFRAIPSGRVCLPHAWTFVVLTVLAGLLIAFFAFRQIFYIYIIFIALNIFYTFIGKKIPYLEFISNSLTHPLRFLMGIVLVSSAIPLNPILAYFFVAIGTSISRRIVELDYKGFEARKALVYYTKKSLTIMQILAFIIILILFIIELPNNQLIHYLLISYYILLVFIIGHCKKSRPILNKIWLN
ncbi:MAG: UbiA family prenyltransferase [Nanoarchaeota archaeon]|nr:UbiA family prenyltransferase [Nanoarchaeota archaeon]MBU4086186.1 UbiA family prenyltransferase [Nanoarchaeota archaeon]